MSLSIREYLKPRNWKAHLHDLATVSPLIAGVIAPLSVLLDIPALTERWYAENGTPQQDPKASLILSGVGLGFSVVANAIMIMRFSESNPYRRMVLFIPLSTLGWLVKVIVSVVNLILFGILTRNRPSYSFLEGFWCAVISCVTSGIVLFFLVLHWAVELQERKKKKNDGAGVNKQVRVSGRHFMLSTTFFLALIAVAALIFSHIEGWTYLEGIYFFVVTFLTVGFGDFSPTHVSTYILLFPFALLGVAALGSLLDVIIRFFSARTASRKAASRMRLEHARQQTEDKRQEPADLRREVEFLERLHEKQDVWDQAVELALTFSGFLAFWLVGAAIFSALEGWTYGIGLYFTYVFFLSIGYGDYAPISPAGRVVFIVYSLLSVPVMAALAVQAVSEVMTRLSTWRLEKRRAAQGIQEDAVATAQHAISHAEYILRERARWKRRSGVEPTGKRSPTTARARSTTGNTGRRADEKEPHAGKEAHSDQEEQSIGDEEKLNVVLVREIVQRAVELELHARRLLTHHLPNGSRAQILLKADRNVQLRDLRAVLRGVGTEQEVDDVDAESTGIRGRMDEEMVERRRRVAERLGLGDAAMEDADCVSKPMEDKETMEEVNRYRESFAGLLVAGSLLQKLQGDELLMLERRREQREATEAERLSATSEHAAAEKCSSRTKV